MCGIAGCVVSNASFAYDLAEQHVRQMLRKMVHRGPDGEGIRIFQSNSSVDEGNDRLASNTVVLGHRRLSIIDLSNAGRQPMSTPDGRYHISFNGEIYNYIELREELKAVYNFTTATDTEVLLAAYAVYGAKMLTKLDGMFAFAIFDRIASQVFCARDPMGIKPFYFSSTSGQFIFASEIPPILGLRPESLVYDGTILAEFLLYGVSDHDERTMYSGVRQLRGGCWMEVCTRTLQLRQQAYWYPPTVTDIPLTEVVDRYTQVATSSIIRQLRSDVPVGSSLSGGIDSGTIVAIVGSELKAMAEQYTTLTLTSPGFENNERDFAEQISRKAGTRFEEVIPEATTLGRDLEKMVQNMCEPFSSLSMFAQYKVMERASHLGLKVMLDGQGGDEVYLGYHRIAVGVLREYLGRGQLRAFCNEWRGFKNNHSLGMIRSLLSGFYFNSSHLVKYRAYRRLARYVSNDLLDLARDSIVQDRFSNKSVLEKQMDELRYYCLPRLLRYADRNSMAFSVEQRVPHLSQGILEFALSVPLASRIRNGWTKYYVRLAMNEMLPKEVLWAKRKYGFDVPQSAWIDRLRPYLKEWLSAIPNTIPINVEQVRDDLDDTRRCKEPHLWLVVSALLCIRLCNARF